MLQMCIASWELYIWRRLILIITFYDTIYTWFWLVYLKILLKNLLNAEKKPFSISIKINTSGKLFNYSSWIQQIIWKYWLVIYLIETALAIPIETSCYFTQEEFMVVSKSSTCTGSPCILLPLLSSIC